MSVRKLLALLILAALVVAFGPRRLPPLDPYGSRWQDRRG